MYPFWSGLFFVLHSINSLLCGVQNPDDWYIIKDVPQINAITEDDYNIYFGTDDGIFSMDKHDEDFIFNVDYSNGLYSPNISHFYYDEFSDYYWVITNNSVSIRSSVSSYWRELNLRDLGINNVYEINDIGSSPNYIWLDVGGYFLAIESAIGIKTTDEIDYTEQDLITWGNSRFGRSGETLDVSAYTIPGDWEIGLKTIKNRHGQLVKPTVWLEDSLGNIWFGTDTGIILKGWVHSHRLEMLEFGLHQETIFTAYKDDYDNWWFADSHFMRTGKQIINDAMFYDGLNIHNRRFLSRWIENANKWQYFLENEIIPMSFQEVHDILRFDNSVYLATLGGIFIYDLLENDWRTITEKNGLYDASVWKLVRHDASLFAITSQGINEISLINYTVIPNKDNWISQFYGHEVYHMVLSGSIAYVATQKGLFSVNRENNEIRSISDKIFKKLQLVDETLYALDNGVWKFNNREWTKIELGIHDFTVCGQFIWMNMGRKAKLVNHESEQFWIYGTDDGLPGSQIYGLDCDPDWVWFLTNKGIAFYQWSQHHYEVD
jgi:hypothetical protein